MKTLLVIIRKEFIQILHNSFLPKLCILFPLMIMLVMPLVTDMEVKNVGLVLVDNDRREFSRHLAGSINASEYLTLSALVPTYEDALYSVEKGHADVILEIPYGFSESLMTRSPMSLNVSANSVNASKGSIGMQYLQQVIGAELAKSLPSAARMPEIRVSTMNMFNPTLNYRFFMIPALTIMLIIMLCGFLPALNVVGEKENGTIEQINVSPVNHLTFTLGKIMPYWIIGFFVLAIAMLVAWIVYGLKPAGSVGALFLASFLFIIVMSSIGVLIANGSNTMQQVMFVMFFFIVTFILMSGLLTPVTSMPQWAQTLTLFLPPRYYIDVMRGIYLRGATLADLHFEYTMLAIFAGVLILAAALTYRKRS